MNFFNTLDLLNKATSLNNEKNSKKLDIELMISSLLNLEKVNLYFNPPLMNDLQREELFSMIYS